MFYRIGPRSKGSSCSDPDRERESERERERLIQLLPKYIRGLDIVISVSVSFEIEQILFDKNR